MSEQWGQQPQQQSGWGQQPPPGYAPQQWGQQQGYPQQGPPQQWGQQPPPQAPQTDPGFTADEFFQQAGNMGAGGAPSFHFSDVGVAVLGRIKSRTVRPKTQPGSSVQQTDRNGKPLWQLNVVLETPLRGWQGIKTPPTEKDQYGRDVPVDPSEDNGERQIYLWYTLREAVEEALTKAGQQSLADGWWLGVKVVGTERNPQGGNPIRKYEAYYGQTREAVLTQAQGGQPTPPAGPPPQQQSVPQQAPQPQTQQGPPPASYSEPQMQPQQGWTAPPAAQQGPPPAGPPPQQYGQEPPF
jgi:hypothetical protein